jgi:hypothetical protein
MALLAAKKTMEQKKKKKKTSEYPMFDDTIVALLIIVRNAPIPGFDIRCPEMKVPTGTALRKALVSTIEAQTINGNFTL